MIEVYHEQNELREANQVTLSLLGVLREGPLQDELHWLGQSVQVEDSD